MDKTKHKNKTKQNKNRKEAVNNGFLKQKYKQILWFQRFCQTKE